MCYGDLQGEHKKVNCTWLSFLFQQWVQIFAWNCTPSVKNKMQLWWYEDWGCNQFIPKLFESMFILAIILSTHRIWKWPGWCDCSDPNDVTRRYMPNCLHWTRDGRNTLSRWGIYGHYAETLVAAVVPENDVNKMNSGQKCSVHLSNKETPAGAVWAATDTPELSEHLLVTTAVIYSCRPCVGLANPNPNPKPNSTKHGLYG